MNFRQLFSHSRFPREGVVFNPLSCCGIAEARIASHPGSAEDRVIKNIRDAVAYKKGLIIWAFRPNGLPCNQEAMDIVSLLPATKYVDSFKNPNTGRDLHVFVTNLTEEW